MSRYPLFDRNALELRPISERGHDLKIDQLVPLAAPEQPFEHPELSELVSAIRLARAQDRPVILMLGAHPIKLGLGPMISDLMHRRIVTHVATNGAGIIHDFELALIGGTSESVARWIQVGQFGLWQETAKLNEFIRIAAERKEGLGEGVGRQISDSNCPNPAASVAASGWRDGVPVSCHVTIGGDITHSLPNCDPKALGETSYRDFLIFAEAVRTLEGGVFLNIGTAVTGPEVFLKALSMARNVARQTRNGIENFTVAVFDLVTVPSNFREGHPSKEEALYYYRPWKTLLCRTISGEGKSYYFQGDHRRTIPTLWKDLTCQ